MIDLGYTPVMHDEFIDTTNNSRVRITSIDPWSGEVGVYITNVGRSYFTFEIIPEYDFQTAVNTGLFKPVTEENPAICFHKWQPYVGFTRKFKFCDKCGSKQEHV